MLTLVQVSFMGDRHVHGYVSHQFSGYSGSHLSLVARARQFSCFVLMVGRIVSADTFEPKYALIVKDKDEVRIPLNAETIPSAKEFRVGTVKIFATEWSGIFTEAYIPGTSSYFGLGTSTSVCMVRVVVSI